MGRAEISSGRVSRRKGNKYLTSFFLRLMVELQNLGIFLIYQNYRKKICAFFIISVVKIAVPYTIVAKMLRRFYYVTTTPHPAFFFRSAYMRQ